MVRKLTAMMKLLFVNEPISASWSKRALFISLCSYGLTKPKFVRNFYRNRRSQLTDRRPLSSSISLHLSWKGFIRQLLLFLVFCKFCSIMTISYFAVRLFQKLLKEIHGNRLPKQRLPVTDPQFLRKLLELLGQWFRSRVWEVLITFHQVYVCTESSARVLILIGLVHPFCPLTPF